MVLLEDVLGIERAHLLARTDTLISDKQLTILNSFIDRRATHEPLAYIRTKCEFYGRVFIVSSDTLVPRPETENMIELIKELCHKVKPQTIIDIGTGSGCIAITAKLELPDSTVIATDIDKKCIEIAAKNAKLLDSDITLLHGSLLEPILSSGAQRPTIIAANLPYVPDNYELNTAATYEPKRALFGGNDGLDVYRRLFDQITELHIKPRYILTESLPFQHSSLAELADVCGYTQVTKRDLVQMFSCTSRNNHSVV